MKRRYVAPAVLTSAQMDVSGQLRASADLPSREEPPVKRRGGSWSGRGGVEKNLPPASNSGLLAHSPLLYRLFYTGYSSHR
jgi:hypothetical protein